MGYFAGDKVHIRPMSNRRDYYAYKPSTLYAGDKVISSSNGNRRQLYPYKSKTLYSGDKVQILPVGNRRDYYAIKEGVYDIDYYFEIWDGVTHLDDLDEGGGFDTGYWQNRGPFMDVELIEKTPKEDTELHWKWNQTKWNNYPLGPYSNWNLIIDHMGRSRRLQVYDTDECPKCGEVGFGNNNWNPPVIMYGDYPLEEKGWMASHEVKGYIDFTFSNFHNLQGWIYPFWASNHFGLNNVTVDIPSGGSGTVRLEWPNWTEEVNWRCPGYDAYYWEYVFLLNFEARDICSTHENYLHNWQMSDIDLYQRRFRWKGLYELG